MDTPTRRHRPRATPEDRRFLDALVFWRRLYAHRGAQDREPIESVAAALAEATHLMRSGAPIAGVTPA
jgi:hypothetical protein